MLCSLKSQDNGADGAGAQPGAPHAVPRCFGIIILWEKLLQNFFWGKKPKQVLDFYNSAGLRQL